MPFQSGDRARIVDALRLDTTQDSAISVLATLMNELESRDTENSTNRAGQIRTLLGRIESAQADLDSLDDAVLESAQKGAVTQESVSNHYTIQYGSSGGNNSGQTTEAMKLERLNNMRQRIKRWLDPYAYLNRYVAVGRAVDG